MMTFKKRKLSEYQGYENVYENTRSKKLRENNFNGYVSGSQVINWFINDCLVDWIKLKDVLSKERLINEDSEEKFLTSQGNLFEQEIIKYINDNITPTVYIGDSRGWNESLVNKTLEEMKKGTPVIYSAALQNRELKVYGTADLLVRNDYLSNIFTDLKVEENEKIKTIFNHPYYYLVIDVKWCTLNLKKDGIEISDTNRFPGYKGQLLIYSRCLEEMQGYFPNRAYLLGRKCTWSEGETKNPFTRPGIFYTSNQEIQIRTNKAIGWIRDLNNEGMNWSLYPPSRPELYPNLGNRSYLTFKKDLANKIGDLSLLCNLKSEKKKKAFEQGIYNIHDSRLNSKILGMDGKDGKILDKILKVNRGENFMLPFKLEGNSEGWRDEKDECFVDFETLNDFGINNKDVMQQKANEVVFLIGVGYKDSKGEWKYKSFVANEISFEGEKRVLERFLDFMSKQGFKKAWYYFAEKTFWKKIVRKHQFRDTSSIFEWKDLHQFIYQNELVFKGSYDFKLKNIIQAFIKEGILNKKEDETNTCKDGLNAMLKAMEFYTNKGRELSLLEDIIDYNYLDVTYLYQILTYLRQQL